MGDFMKNFNNVLITLISGLTKTVIIMILIYVQIEFVKIEVQESKHLLIYLNFAVELLKVILVIHIIYKFQSVSYKLLWIILIMFFPILGAILYLMLGNSEVSKSFKKRIDEEYSNSQQFIEKNDEELEEIKKIDKVRYNQVNYIYNTNKLPIYKSPNLQYLKSGEEYFESILKDIANAREYIFIQYFTISEGSMWNRLFDILKQKSLENVKIYIIVDGMGNQGKFPKDFKQKLEKFEIKFYIFNSSLISINEYLNYRSHRKIVVIDGNIAYTGGVNIGDEYINLDKRYGHWKDSGIKILGSAVTSYIIMFIRMWNLRDKKSWLDYKKFINRKSKEDIGKGYIVPYCDSPDNKNNTAQNLYIQIINSAKDYVYIMTPYLSLDCDIVTAFANAAKSGVDVRIIIPSISDKLVMHFVNRAFYQILLEAGVKIYEYKPGFIHSKVFISDDELATVGSINLDFRGLYFHFECGNWIYKTGEEEKIKQDFLDTLEQSLEINLIEWNRRGIIKRIIDKIIVTFSPLV